MEVVGKVSNKGWTVHKRLLELTSNALRYFSEVPKDMKDKAQLGKIMKKGAKLTIDLSKITCISLIDKEDAKKFKKLKDKNAINLMIKIQFSPDAIMH